jgi:1,2-diacylglycerol 3-beta-galactosyltransferase
MYGGAERRKEVCPVVTVVTDLGSAHPMWFHQKVDTTYVPSDVLERKARRSGIPEENVVKIGLPIRPEFSARYPDQKKRLQRALGLAPGARTALIVGGGDGVGKIGPITRAMADELSKDGGGDAQLVVVCGKNEDMKAKLEAEDWPENVKVTVQGFVKDMDRWMGAADCIVTKAGPGTIAEATASGIPIMLTSHLPGQEAGNVPFVVKGGFGAFSKNPQKIAKTVSTWLKDPVLLAEISSKSRDAGRPEATLEIAKDIGKKLFPEVLKTQNIGEDGEVDE